MGGAAFARGPFSFLCDDAFIALRYARNLAQLGIPVYNANPVEWVEGYTSPLWVAGMAVLAILGMDLEWGALMGSAIGALATLGLTGRIAAQLAGDDPKLRRWAAWLAGLCLVWVPQWFVWSSGGLETSCAAALGLAACDARLRSQHRRFYICTALSALARLDSLVWIFAFTIADRFGGTRDRILRPAALWLLVIAGHSLLRFVLYGEWLPQTWLVKRHGAQLASTWGLAYVQHWAWDGAMLLLAVPLLFGLRKWSSLAALVVANLIYAYAVGGDFMGYSRFLLPATCASAAGYAVACARAERYLVAASTSGNTSRILVIRTLAMLVPLFFALRWADVVKKDRASSWLESP